MECSRKIQVVRRVFENKENRESLMADPFIREHIAELLKTVRTRVLLLLVKPYKIVRLSYISRTLGIKEYEMESVLSDCILNRFIDGRIDQVNKILIRRENHQDEKYVAMEKLVEQINKLSIAIGI